MIRSGQQNGFILMPVVLAIVLIATLAFLLNNQSAINVDMTASQAEAQQVDAVVQAGLQHALWGINNSGCSGNLTLPATAFGNGSYTATVTSAATTSSYTLNASQDTWLKEAIPAENHGGDSPLSVKAKAGDNMRTLYQFDISPIPAGSQIGSATAWFYVNANDDQAAVNVHEITTAWVEGTADWASLNDKFDSSVIASIPAQASNNVWVQVNLTSLVQAWVNGSANNGIMLLANSSDVLSTYGSSEAASSQHPRIEVVVTNVAASPVTISATGTLTGNPSPANDITRSLTQTNVPAYQPGSYTTLQPGAASGKDAEIWDQKPNNNYGAAAETWVSSASNDTTRSLLQFNMGEIPAGARILEATLSLNRQSGSGADQPVSAHRIRNAWSEDSVSWNSRETGTSWDTAGGDFDNIAVTTTPVGPVNQRYEWNIAPLVQGWVDSSYPNYGVALVAAIAGMPGQRFYTSDDSVPTRHPKLTVTYSCECGVTCQAPQGSGKLIFVVIDAYNMTPEEQAKKSLFESWGYQVTPLSQWDVDWNYSNLVTSHDVTYVNNTVDETVYNLKPPLAASSIGVINEKGPINNDLGTSTGFSYSVAKDMDVIDTSHYITTLFPSGMLPIYSANMENMLASGTLATDLQVLGSDFYGAPSLAVVATGGLLADGSSTAAGNRVMLPIGRNGNFNWDYLNNNGRLIVQRAIQWGIDGVAPVPTAKKIYWTDDVAEIIQRSDEDGSNVETVISGQFKVRGLDIDTVNGKIYWTSDDYIIRADLDGSNIEKVYSTATKLNFDVKLDLAAGKMYWTYDNLDNEVMRANLDGSNVQTLNTSTNRPMYFSLDAANGFIYVTEYGNNSISRLNMDGSAVTTIVIGSGSGNIGSAIDTVNGKIYWTGGSTNDWIKRANLDGSNEETIISGQNSPQDISYDADNDRIYWTDAVDFVIRRANADGSNVETIVSAVNRPRGIVAVDADLVPPTGGATGPIAHWKLDEIAGTNAVDSVGGHDGTLINGTDWSVGQVDGALNFNGSSDYINVPHADTLSLTDTMTFAAWVNASSYGASYQTIVAKDSGAGDSNYYFGTYQQELVFGFFSGPFFREIFTTGLNLQPDTWYQLAASFDNATDEVRLYVDGVEVHSGTLAFTPAAVSADLTIGKSPIGEYWRGLLDDVRIYDSVLPAGEIADLYTVGGGGGGGGSPPPGPCDGTYRDEFSTVSYGNNDGSLSWTTDWIEINESDGANSGDEKIMSDTGHSSLRLTDNDGGGEGVEREADLSGAVTASLSLLYRRNKLDDIDDNVKIWISTNGSVGPWSELIFFAGGGTDSDYVPFTLDISTFISANTRIRFLTSPTMGGKDEVYFDDIQIECSP